MTLPGETVGTGADHPGTPLQVCWSAAGYYIGYLDHDGSPYSRESVNYWPTAVGAATTHDWSQGLIQRPLNKKVSTLMSRIFV